MNRHTHLFTLVEIMIVVAIIGLLATLVMPSMINARERAQATRFINDMRVATGAFEMYAIEEGGWPADRGPGAIPAGMADYLTKFAWNEDTSIGGKWDWDYLQFGCVAGVSVYLPNRSAAEMAEIDGMFDDGNLSSGFFRQRSQGYINILE
jgi:prepilin-type N-terminal cleavage/methylation domain-containing protein